MSESLIQKLQKEYVKVVKNYKSILNRLESKL